MIVVRWHGGREQRFPSLSRLRVLAPAGSSFTVYDVVGGRWWDVYTHRRCPFPYTFVVERAEGDLFVVGSPDDPE